MINKALILNADEFRKLCHDNANNVQIGFDLNLGDLTLEDRDDWIDGCIEEGGLNICIIEDE